MKWSHEVDDMATHPPDRPPLFGHDTALLNHLVAAHGQDVFALLKLTVDEGRAAHVRYHDGDPGALATEPQLREPRWPWSRA